MDEFFLEGKISAERYDKLARKCTAGWEDGFAFRASENKSIVDDVVYRRHDNTVRFLIPWLNEVYPLEGSNWIDFGSGCGSSSLALSHFVKEIKAFEIDKPSISAFNTRMEIFNNKKNVEGPQCAISAEDIIADVVDSIDQNTSVLFLAVVEHLLEEERLNYLKKVWDALHPGHILVVVETPNFACWQDTHTHGEPFTHLASDKVFFEYIKRRRSDMRFRDDLISDFRSNGLTSASTKRWRYGIGCTHHLFEAAFGIDLNEIVITDGFSLHMINWFPLIPDDKLLTSMFDTYDIKIPVGFARAVLSFVFKKPADVQEAAINKQWNETRRNEIVKRYSLFQEGINKVNSKKSKNIMSIFSFFNR